MIDSDAAVVAQAGFPYALVQINLLVTNGAQISEKAGEPPSTDPALLDLVARMGTYQHFSNLNMADFLGVEFAQTYLRSGSRPIFA